MKCDIEHGISIAVLTRKMFSRDRTIFSGWMAERTKMRVTTSTLAGGTSPHRSSWVRSHRKALQRSGQYRGCCCQQTHRLKWIYLLSTKSVTSSLLSDVRFQLLAIPVVKYRDGVSFICIFFIQSYVLFHVGS